MSTAEQPRVSRGLLVALGAVVGLALLAALWFFVVSPLLEDEPVAAPGAVELADEGDDPAPEPEETAEPEPTPPPETEEVFTARDPFQQLVQPAVASTDTGDSGTDDGDSEGEGGEGEGGDSAGGDSAGGDSAGGDSAGGDSSDEPAPGARVGNTTVRLVDVVTGDDGTERVVVTVNGLSHEAAENDTFAERFRVLDISGECATFLFGDNRFTLCKGESIRK